MRIIKLSASDEEMNTRDMVDLYFKESLANRDPAGQFLLTKGRIRMGGIVVGEPLIFTYKGEIIYIAKASSGRFINSGSKSDIYPFYFIVDVNTIAPVQESLAGLADLEAMLRNLGIFKNIVKSRGWPIIKDSPETNQIWNKLNTLTSH